MKRGVVLLLVGFIILTTDAYACTLVMGYRTTPRLPNIEAAPNNSGIYEDLYTTAAKNIGCSLDIVRLPKKRILAKIASGQIDFYPGFTFTKARSQYAFFFKNGLYTQVVGLSRADMPEVKSLHDIQGKTFLRPLGGPGVNPKKYGFFLHEVPELNYTIMVKMLLSRHADFFMDHYYNLKFFLKDHPARHEFRFHMACCGKKKPFALGFSRTSAHYQEEPNPAYDPNQPLAMNNFPVRLKKDQRLTACNKLSSLLKNQERQPKSFSLTPVSDYEGEAVKTLATRCKFRAGPAVFHVSDTAMTQRKRWQSLSVPSLHRGFPDGHQFHIIPQYARL